MHLSRIALSVRARIPETVFATEFPSPVSTLGTQVATQVLECANALALGYYPALDFAKQQDCIEPFIIDALEQVSEFTLHWSKNEIFALLRPIFSNVVIESQQLVCNTMPTVRPGQAQALTLLAAHFTPDVIKCELNVAMLHKHAPDPNADQSQLASAAKKTVHRWLSESFIDVDISSARKE